ncbi:protein starmaker-like isoform X2 [Pocillopora verrucosa]|uniref:protein starmaker-like isoform X2 n=1 Tax=Pocillopora verrucosa TaxID=203993 RepID=UPI00333F5387
MEAGKVKLEGQEEDKGQGQEKYSVEDTTGTVQQGQEEDKGQGQEKYSVEDTTGTVQQAYGQNTRNERRTKKTDDKISKGQEEDKGQGQEKYSVGDTTGTVQQGQEEDKGQGQEKYSVEETTGTVQQAYGQNTRNETTRNFSIKTDDKISKLLLHESTTGNQQGLSDDQSNGFLFGISRHITTFKHSSVKDVTQKNQAPPNTTKSVSYDRPSSSQNDLPDFEDSDADSDEEAPHQPYIIAGEDGASSSEDSVVDEDSAPHQPYIIAGEDGASSSEDSVVDEDSGYLASSSSSSSSSPSEDSEVDEDSEHFSTSDFEDRLSQILLTLVIGDEQLAELSALLNGGEPSAPHQPYIIAGEDGASSSEDSVVDEDSAPHQPYIIAGEDGASSSEDSGVDEDSAPDGADDEGEWFQDCLSRFEILKQAK